MSHFWAPQHPSQPPVLSTVKSMRNLSVIFAYRSKGCEKSVNIGMKIDY